MATRAQERASAVNRFGLGARPGDLASTRSPRDEVIVQTRTALPVPRGLPSSADYLARESGLRRARASRAGRTGAPRADAAGASRPSFRRAFADDLVAEALARWQLAVTSAAGFQERMVRFWSNHFAVSVDKRAATLYAMPMEREAIRPHAFGRFADLLVAVETHPAMLRYLDNAQSIGPASRLAARARHRGLNENLAREILELHTLGVDGGYSQGDVLELARAITGWGLVRGQAPVTAGGEAFAFHALAHEPGPRTLLGRRYPQAGMGQGRAMLADLAVHPATARHVSARIARHFVADQPDGGLVATMTHAWLASGGDLGVVCRTMIEDDRAWGDHARKFKSPQDLVLSALRAGNARIDRGHVPTLNAQLERLGHPDLKPRSPAGFPDTREAWLGADALWKRLQVAAALAAYGDADALARPAPDTLLDPVTAAALARAGSAREGLALLFASPTFQWRC